MRPRGTQAHGLGRALLAIATTLSPGAFAAEPPQDGALPEGDTRNAPRSSSAPLPAMVRLDYEREREAAGCVAPSQLVRDVEARLGRRVFVSAERAEPAELVARVRAGRVARRFRIELELFDRAGRSLGRRELSSEAAHCSSLDDSLALVLALAADMPREPAPVAEPSTEPPASAGQVPPPAEPAPEAPASPPAAPPLNTPLSIPPETFAPRLGARLRPTLGVVAAAGIVPSIAPGLELGLELTLNRFWPIRLHGAGFTEQQQPAGVTGKEATFSAQTLSLGVCPWMGPLGPFEGSVCAVQCFGRVRARGVGFDEEQRNTGWLLHAGAGLALAHELGPLFVAASATLLVPVVRRRYFFDDGADITLYEQPWLGGLVALRVGTEI